jgi:hypothetical protein
VKERHDGCCRLFVVKGRGTAIPVKRPAVKRSSRTAGRKAAREPQIGISGFAAGAFFIGLVLAVFIWQVHIRYAFSLQTPVRLHFQWPLVMARRAQTDGAVEARFDQHGHALTAYQQYACAKFGEACRVALAIQRAENPQGRCEIYHYNSDGTLDWGYFQINTVHLKRPGLNLRDLLDCKANIDFAYQLYQERQGFTPWSTYNSGAYRKFLHE